MHNIILLHLCLVSWKARAGTRGSRRAAVSTLPPRRTVCWPTGKEYFLPEKLGTYIRVDSEILVYMHNYNLTKLLLTISKTNSKL